ncbi:hypothetical protein PVAP13_5KG441907 [Panicum virgatum]|uniref:Uncharacterized protein n=1 Tax=Panicum virgatum TaxID=38727 RepID=A0A8T0SQH9_PANVG|nr:hypothetical protein PVAP13_5KG441907 [Panicum virgatum]
MLVATGLSPDYYRAEYNFRMPSARHRPAWTCSSSPSRRRRCSRGSLRETAPWRVPGGAGLLGEIGGNDYNFWFSGPRHAGPVHSGRRRPHRRHRAGGDRPRRQIVLVVPGNFPIGCAPQYLGMFRSDAASDYDQHGCLAWFNDFSRRNNRLLQQQEVGLLRSQNPSAKIIFADYFGVAIACRSSRTPGNTVRRRC